MYIIPMVFSVPPGKMHLVVIDIVDIPDVLQFYRHAIGIPITNVLNDFGIVIVVLVDTSR